MSLDALSRQLWKQREILEVLLFKLEEERLLVSTASSRWLPRATRELETVITQAQSMELERSMESENAAISLGLEPTASLRDIAEAAQEPWSSLLHQHREALMGLTTEIGDISKNSREQISALQRAAQETLLTLQESISTYDGKGTATQYDTSGSLMLDESM